MSEVEKAEMVDEEMSMVGSAGTKGGWETPLQRVV